MKYFFILIIVLMGCGFLYDTLDKYFATDNNTTKEIVKLIEKETIVITNSITELKKERNRFKLGYIFHRNNSRYSYLKGFMRGKNNNEKEALYIYYTNLNEIEDYLRGCAIELWNNANYLPNEDSKLLRQFYSNYFKERK